MSETQRPESCRVALWMALLLIAGLNLTGCRMGATDAATRGQEVFETCVPCHNSDGSGNPTIGAPNIAGMKSWYVERELDKFRAGVRGMHFSDVEGMRMRPMALSLPSEEDVKAVAHYVETLPPVAARLDASRRSESRRDVLRDLRGLPRRQWRRESGPGRAADRGNGRLVSGHGASKIQERRSRHRSKRSRRKIDAPHGEGAS